MNNRPLYQTSFDSQSCNIGIVHIGYGNFHRAHQAVYIDDYMQASGDLNWGIAAVNLRASETEYFRHAAQAKEGYVVKAIAPDGAISFRLVRSHMAFVDVPSEQEKAISLLNNEIIKVVTVTVTESGYYLDQNSQLDLSHDFIKESLNGTNLETIYAYLCTALKCRAEGVGKPVTILCCDNMRSNGIILKNALLSYIKAMGDDALFSWVKRNVTFPCSMVDRITPQSSQALREEISTQFADSDIAPVHAETFIQWVIENDFASDIPGLEDVGVQIVPEVEPLKKLKSGFSTAVIQALPILVCWPDIRLLMKQCVTRCFSHILINLKLKKCFPVSAQVFLLIPKPICLKLRQGLRIAVSLMT